MPTRIGKSIVFKWEQSNLGPFCLQYRLPKKNISRREIASGHDWKRVTGLMLKMPTTNGSALCCGP